MKAREHLPLLAVAGATLLWLAALAGLRPLALPDEGRYVGIAWEMLRSGHWAVPTLDGLPFFHKPPLFYWLTAAALQCFGSTAWAARAASLLAATLAALALHAFIARTDGPAMARVGLLALLTQPFFYIAAQFANLDMLVAGCITLAVLGAAWAVLQIEAARDARPALAAAWAAVGLGLLAKGLIGAVLPMLIVGGWLAWTRRLALVGRLLWWPGLLLAALLALPWFVGMQQRYDGFLDYFVLEQHVRRYAQAGFNNVQPFWFYLPVLALLALPWSLWALWPLRRAAPAADDPARLRPLMLVWLAVVLLFFSLPRSKLVGYVLPALPPLAWLAADRLRRRYGEAMLQRRAVRWSLAVAALACVGAVVAAATLQQGKSSEPLARALREARQPGEPVLMLERYVYDLPFYAHLAEPAVVIDDWDAARREGRDNWHKELLDAARFDAAAAQRALLPPGLIEQADTGNTPLWLIGPDDATQRHPRLASAERVAGHGGLSLWRLPPSTPPDTAAKAPQTPSDGSPGK